MMMGMMDSNEDSSQWKKSANASHSRIRNRRRRRRHNYNRTTIVIRRRQTETDDNGKKIRTDDVSDVNNSNQNISVRNFIIRMEFDDDE